MRRELSLLDTLYELAGSEGAYIDWDSENFPRLYKPTPQPSQEVLHELLHYGYLEKVAGRPGMNLSREGHLALMRASDEMGDGIVRRPFETCNQNPGSPHPESSRHDQ
jgi:hypothetical protein